MSDTSTGTTPEGKGISAKFSSLIAQIVAAIWITGWAAYKFISAPASIDIGDVIFSGVGIAACFTPVYFSIIMDKIKEWKLGAGIAKSDAGSGGGL